MQIKLTRFALLLLLLIGAPLACASSLDVNVIAMFPMGVAEFAYLDVEQARQYPWFAQFRLQTLPPRFVDLEAFLASAGISTGSQVSAVAWATTTSARSNGEQEVGRDVNGVVGIALGHFDSASINAALKSKKQDGVNVGDFTLYTCGPSCAGLSFVIIDSGTLAFGERNALEGMLDVRNGIAASVLENEPLTESINKANGQGAFWSVLGAERTRETVRDLVPEIDQFPQAVKLLHGVKSLVITADASDTIDTAFEIVAASPEDAAMLGQLVQAGLVVRQYQARQTNSGMTEILEKVRITQSGSGLTISLSANKDQMIGLVQQGTVATQK